MSLVSDLGDLLLSGMLTYGYSILAITLLLGAVGLPVPASLVATIAGTLVADGDLSAVPTLLVALFACVAGDLVGYSIGRLGGDQFARRHGRWVGMGAKRLLQAETLYLRWAGPTLLLSRSLLAIVAPAVNLRRERTTYAILCGLRRDRSPDVGRRLCRSGIRLRW
jgi:membrane protein DedA with SNARE-associated domain